MKKVAIITFTYGNNYGQRLQNYALQNVLKKYNLDVYTIPQRKKIHNFKQKIKKIINLRFTICELYRSKLFELFDKENIIYYKHFIAENLESFNVFNMFFDVFVVGSDQVWNPFSPDVNETFFLTFAEKSKRIAYAPSFSVDELPIECIEKYKKYISGFDNDKISVREDRGADIIKNLGGDSCVVLDPTLLVDKNIWGIVSKKPNIQIKSGYILMYILGNDKKSSIDRYAKNKGLEIIILKEGTKEFSKTGPAEFLYLIENAEYIITDSYHGTIFSILNHKQFRNISRETDEFCMKSRFLTLYDKLGIDPEEIYGEIDSSYLLDYNLIDEKIEHERKKSQHFLDNIFLE